MITASPAHAGSVDLPSFWLLNPRVGWRAAELQHVDIAPSTGALVLARIPASGRALNEASGSFGGIRPPSHVDLAHGGQIYLLDPETAQLKVFHPCACRFVTVPCFSGIGAGARQLLQAGGIAICNGNLYVADTGNRCVKVFALSSFSLRALWRPPASANLASWQPSGVACDRRGRVYVADPANGLIHSFSPAGQWQQFASGLGAAGHIAIDCNDRIYVVVGEAPDAVRAFDVDGKLLDSPWRPEALAAHFPRLPFSVDAQGNLDLSEVCLAHADPTKRLAHRFDKHGHPLKDDRPVVLAMPSFETEGTYYSQPLDSQLYRCQWHRVVVRGRIPQGTRILASTYTAETEQTNDHILALPAAWETNQTAFQMDKDGGWDCLTRSAGGRYLWLRLTFYGNGDVTPSIESIRVEFPRISLRRYLPAVFGADPVSADFTDRFLSIFDTTLRNIKEQIDTQARFFDPRSTPADPAPGAEPDVLTWLASWIGLVLDRQMPESKRRRLVANAARLYQVRGTREGLRRQLLLFLGAQPEALCCAADQPTPRCQPRPANCAPTEKKPCAWQPPPLILEHFQLRRWLFLGAGRLGDQAEIWGRSIVNRSQLNENAQVDRSKLITTQDPLRDPFHVYAHKFSVFVPARFGRSEGSRRALQNLIRLDMPAHAQMNLEFVEPRLRIGFQASIGLNTVVGCYPQGVTLNDMALGAGTVLSKPPGRQGGPSFAIGQAARVGSTTRLD